MTMTSGQKNIFNQLEHSLAPDWTLEDRHTVYIERGQGEATDIRTNILPIPGEAKAKAMPGRLYIHTK